MKINNKFGTFSGVFTPSLLTILGVIMYMRLGWVVGEAGLIATVGIILIAHIISVTTGLSISSIATDKKIKVGGIYYILSRTLGLPMGGAIGIVLFLGTALSISLYIIGFAESFLNIPAIADFFHLQPGVDSYRIVGTAVIILLVVMAFISTSLAIKSQFLILGAIILSLVSIFVGFFLHPDMMPQKPLLSIASENVSLEMVFAVFFPAVTGFTAGVAMSGDLKDPKKNIPIGTIMAIIVGFLVYMSMAVGFAYFVNRSDLINDMNIVMKVAWIPVLVVAGIWGATLSSALGGILGGPRILQALAKDKIMPAVFSKGYGINNEPRNALILIFLIAEGGILIGELNLIAGLVTMFYLASYGFINLAYVLESWASTDFRPSFKVSRVFGIIGFVFAFAIMFKLDMISMLAAFVIIFGIYITLKRKQMRLEFGDVWQSVWSSIVRRGLYKLNTKVIEERNWQPNIILFTGETGNLSYLILFGKSLVGRFGMLSVFNLVETPEAKVLFPKYKQRQPDKDNNEEGVFMRRQSCKNIYDGIEMIARTYGFSGIEPNTLIMGWARQTRNPVRFKKLLQTLNDLDYNILLIDYDKRYGYGKFKQIDIWWRGEGNNGNLALTLAKFMVASTYWENAQIRLMIVNFENEKAPYIHHRVDEILANMRLDAEVKVINNQIEKIPVYEIIRSESKNADIVFLGIPDINVGNEETFVQRTNELLREIGTVVLLRASSVFKKMSFGINKNQEVLLGKSSDILLEKSDIKYLIHKSLRNKVHSFATKLIDAYNKTFQNYTLTQKEALNDFFKDFKQTLDNNLLIFRNRILQLPPDKINRIAVNHHHALFSKINRLFTDFEKKYFESLQILMNTVIAEFDAAIQPLWKNIPETVFLFFPKEDFEPKEDDSYSFRFFKKRKLLGNKNDIISVSFALQKKLKDLNPLVYKKLIDTIGKTGIETIDFFLRFRNLLKTISLEFALYRKWSLENNLTIDKIEKSKQTILNKVNELDAFLDNFSQRVIDYFENGITDEINKLLKDTNSLKTVYYFKKKRNTLKELKQNKQKLLTLANPYFSNLSLFLNIGKAENYLLQYNTLVNAELNEILVVVNTLLTDKLIYNIDKLADNLQTILVSRKHTEIPYDRINTNLDDIFKKIKITEQKSIKSIKRILKSLPMKITVMDEASFNDFFHKQFDEIKIVTVAFLQMIEFLTNNEIENETTNYIIDLQRSIQEQMDYLEEYYRLFFFTMNENKKNESEDKVFLENFLQEQIEKILAIKDNIKKELKEFSNNITELKTKISGQTTLYGLIKFEANLKYYISDQKEQKKIVFIQRQKDLINNWVSKQIVRFKYGKTEAVSYVRYIRQDTILPTLNNRIIAINNKIQPSGKILSQIPFYYKQLFSATQTFYKEFWIPMERELKTANMIFEQYSRLHEGALLLTGASHSGKSFLAYMLAHQWNQTGRVLFVNPPIGGRLSIETFKEVIADVFQVDKYNENLFNTLPDGSFIIFDDIELWWQRDSNSLTVLKYIFKLIEKFSNKIFFILNINVFAFKLLEKILLLDINLLGVVKINQLPVYAIKDMILLRHKGTGFNFIYKNIKSNGLSTVKMADLFVQLYKFSHGNAGITMALWLSSIKKKENDSLWIEPPTLSGTAEVIHLLSKNIKLLLLQILLHKQITKQGLEAITCLDTTTINKNLIFLRRMEMINELQTEIFEINIYWYPVIVDYFISKNLI